MPPLGRTIRKIPAARLIVLAELLLLAREHVAKLEPQERRRILELVRRGRGRTRNLTERDRRELARLIEKAEPRLFVGNAIERLVGFPPGRGGKERD
jgi:hypothetical protein